MDDSPTTLSPKEYEERKQSLEEIKNLTKEQYEGLYVVIRQTNISYTENSNGIFFDLTTLTKQQFQKVQQFLKLCSTQNLNEQERSKELQTLRDETETLAVK